MITDFATVKVDMGRRKFPQTPLAGVAEFLLGALQRLSVGKVAPKIEGVDLDGNTMKLSDYRGKIVVLYIRGHLDFGFFPPDQIPKQTLSRFRPLAERVQGKPVSLLGVVGSQRDGYQKAIQEQHVPMRIWWDPEVSKSYSKIRWAYSVPSEDIYYVLDRDGVIRFKLTSIRAELDKAVSVLLDEMAERDRSEKPR